MSDLYPLIFILVLFLAPVAGFWWLYRLYLLSHNRRVEEQRAMAERLAQRQRAEPAAHAPAHPREVDHAATKVSGVPPAGHRISFPLGFPIIVYPLLLWGIAKAGPHWWGWIFQLIYLALLGLFSWEAFSRAEFENAHSEDPGLNRLTWVMNWLLFFVMLPAAVWVVAMVMLR